MILDPDDHFTMSKLRLAGDEYRILCILDSRLFVKKTARHNSIETYIQERLSYILNIGQQSIRLKLKSLQKLNYVKNTLEVNRDFLISKIYFNG